ncbi:hypothetical protein [Rhodoferax fermentans]|uniref:Uncharacterized protein n=1 Tax=Rhodoferax fermentans TaxID=28066 RepID=A0A1T1ANW3_RHOFE|nr:hypothetical protein [Rhodoferax fermentans]MBK1683459.1 hypothetical protein [Rhodoferax fermentans]OOV05799.1 hypothetical protein RF819_02910 [Rhodoferax fermentans]
MNITFDPAATGADKTVITTWLRRPAILNRPHLSPDSIIAVGFGSAFCTKDLELICDEQDVPEGDEYRTCADIELLAAADPDHDWQINYHAPLYDAVYQRQDGFWVLIEEGRGFA